MTDLWTQKRCYMNSSSFGKFVSSGNLHLFTIETIEIRNLLIKRSFQMWMRSVDQRVMNVVYLEISDKILDTSKIAKE